MLKRLRAIDLLPLTLIIIGGLNWGLVGVFQFDLVATLFGAGSLLARLVYILVGASALWLTARLIGAASFGSHHEHAAHTAH